MADIKFSASDPDFPNKKFGFTFFVCASASPIFFDTLKSYTEEMNYFVYLLRCKDDSIYMGITTDLERRFNEYKNKKGGRYARSRKVDKIIYAEKRSTRSAALKREAEIKSWRREKKIKLIDPKVL
jgi:putative endonuclease